MAVLANAQNVARLCQLDVPAQVMSATGDTAKILRACAQRAGDALSRRHDWEILMREHTFTTVDGTDDYALPSDFGRFVDGTVWDRANFNEMRGPMSPAEWQAFKSSALGGTVGLPRRWRARYSSSTGALRFTVDPAVSTTGNTLVFEYVTNAWCESSVGVGQTAFALDTDVFRLDAYLLELSMTWRVLERLGMAYVEARDECDREVDAAVARDGGSAKLSLNPPLRNQLISSWQVQDGNWPVP